MKPFYLVTGGAGYLGGEVCRQLAEKGARARTLVLPNDKGAAYIPEAIERCEGDLCDIPSLKRFFAIPEGYECIVLHCASIVALGDERRELVMKVNVQGTKNIIEQCFSSPCFKKLVYIGSTGAIPELPKGQAISEAEHYDADKVVSLYGQSKAMATQAVLDAARERGLNACAVLPSGILGPGDYAIGSVTAGQLQQMNGDVPIGINGTFNLCDVRDLANGILLAVDRGKAGQSYILANEVVSYKQYTRIVAEEAHCKCPRLFLPIAMANLIAGIQEKQARKNNTRPALSKYMLYNLSRNNKFDTTKARRELGYTTRPFRETVRDEVKWLKEIGKIN